MLFRSKYSKKLHLEKDSDMNEIYCKLISRKLLYDYFHYSKIQQKQFKKNLLRPLLRRVGNKRFWDFHNEVKKSSNQYLISCNSITKDKVRLGLLEKKTLKGLKKSKYYLVNKKQLVVKGV